MGVKGGWGRHYFEVDGETEEREGFSLEQPEQICPRLIELTHRVWVKIGCPCGRWHVRLVRRYREQDDCFRQKRSDMMGDMTEGAQ